MILILVLCILLFSIIDTKESSGVDIYNSNLLTTVEIKSSSENRETFGTGFFVDDKGTIVTNSHIVVYSSTNIIQEYDTYEIRFATENEYISVKLMRYDTDLDLAILSLEKDYNYEKVNLNCKKISNGNDVYTIGNMQNYGLSIAKGIVSKKELLIEINGYKRAVIQLDLSVSEGNSGGPVFTSDGKCIGIISFRLKDEKSQLNYGYCYAISSNLIQDFID